MSAIDYSVLVADAIRRLFAAADLPWPPPAQAVAPVPLDRLIRTMKNLEHIELSELTPAIASDFLSSAGARWPELRKDDTVLDGLLIAKASGGYVFVRADANNPLPRRRFTAAHELGHYLLHFLPSLESRPDPDAPFVRVDSVETVQECDEEKTADDKALSLPEMERQANRFAAELLMPEAVCRLASEQYKRASTRFLEHHLASNLLVSDTAIRWRLRNLGLAS
jgi:hypothetical protein